MIKACENSSKEILSSNGANTMLFTKQVACGRCLLRDRTAAAAPRNKFLAFFVLKVKKRVVCIFLRIN